MKILMVNKFLYPNGGSETYVFELGRQLERMGHEVQYFGMEDVHNIVGNHVESYTTNMNFHGNYFAKLFYPFKIIYSVEARKKIRKVIEDFHPDIVHLNNFNFQLTPSILYEIKKKHIPIIYTAHDCQLVCPNHLCMNYKTQRVCEKCQTIGFTQCAKYKCIHGSCLKSMIGMMEAQLYKLLRTYKMIDVILCPSDFMKHMLDTNMNLYGRTITMQNFTNLPKREKHNSLNQNSVANKYILYFGRYEKEKGMETLIEACRKLPEIQFKFAGKGTFFPQIKKLGNVTECGFLESVQLMELIENATFTICASECYENCPFSIMESIMCKVPVLGSRLGGIPELIDNGKNGLLFTSGDVIDLVDKIKYLWYNEEVCRDMKTKCKDMEFDDLEIYTKKIINLYQKEISRSL